MLNFAANDMHTDMDAAERERQERIDWAWRAYHGDLPKPLKVRGFDDNVQPNFTQAIVDIGVSFLFGKDIPFDTDPASEGLTETPEETYLDTVWQGNDKSALLIKLGLNGGVCGHAFLKIKRRMNDVPRILLLDPATVCVHWNDDDLEDVYRYTQSWRAINRLNMAVTRRQVTERNDNGLSWTITDQEANADNGPWRILTTELWPYPFAPIFQCQNLPAPNEFWGLSDLETHVITMQQALSFTLSNLQKTVRLHAHPKPVAIGVNATEIDASPDKVTAIPLGGDLKYMQASPFQSSSLELYERLQNALYTVTKTPELAMGKMDNVGQLSGLALQILYGPLLSKTNTKRALYGPMLQRVNQALLMLGGFASDTPITLQWQNPLPQNGLEERQVAQIDKDLGVSTDTILTKLGYDAEAEAAKKQAQTPDPIPLMTPPQSGVAPNGQQPAPDTRATPGA